MLECEHNEWPVSRPSADVDEPRDAGQQESARSTGLSAYRGARVAAPESSLITDTFAALGAQTALYAAGQKDFSGDDGIENHAASVWGNGFQSTWRHLTANVNLWPRPLVIMANPALFSALAPSQQEALTGAAAATLENALRATADSDPDAMANLCATGMTFDVATDANSPNSTRPSAR